MAKAKRNSKNNDEGLFYEAMPATATRYEPRAPAKPDELYTEFSKDDEKFTAIMTILMVVLLTLVMSIIFIRGIEEVKKVSPAVNEPLNSQPVQ